jgi:hypothetical protein
MTDSTHPALLEYVQVSASLLGLPLDSARAGRVAAHLQRTAAMAALLEAASLPLHVEIAEIYSPAAYLPNDNGRE